MKWKKLDKIIDKLLFPKNALERILVRLFMNMMVLIITILIVLAWALVAESISARWLDGQAFTFVWIGGIVFAGMAVTMVLRK